MSHLEVLIAEYLSWQGYQVKRNTKVGRLKHGGWEMELDVVAYHPKLGTIIHYEPSLDAHAWEKRDTRYKKKFEAARKYILKEMFEWLPETTPIQQIAVFPSHPKGRDTIAGGAIMSIDELMSEIKTKIVALGPMSKNAITEQYPLLRTIQLSHAGYSKVLKATSPAAHPPPRSRRGSLAHAR